MPIIRKLFVTDRFGVEHEIKSQADLQKILDQMTPEERKIYADRYRFAPVLNKTGLIDYTGTARDLM